MADDKTSADKAEPADQPDEADLASAADAPKETKTDKTSVDKPAEPPKKDNADEGAQPGAFKRFWAKYTGNKKVSIPLTILAVALLILIIPASRYTVLGLFIKKDFTVQIVDSKTGDPVTSADISLAGSTAKSDDHGKAVLHVKLGDHQLSISKKYYADLSHKVLVSLSSDKNNYSASLVATGRLVPVTVSNKINGQAIGNATISAGGIEAKTNSDGTATVALPADQSTVDGTLSASGYNQAKVTIKITDQKVSENNFNLTPAGKVYFLSKASGKIDVVKTDLDGANRQTVLAGTGNEDDTGTILLASRDWKYLALESNRDGKSDKLYLISTADDKVITMDEGDNVSFSLVGWADDRFVYVVYRNNVKSWQPNSSSLKSYNAESNQVATLDSTTASGTNDDDAVYETYLTTIFIFNNQVVYAKNWDQGQGYPVDGKSNTLYAVNTDGSGKHTISKVNSTNSYYGGIYQPQPNQLLIQVSPQDDSSENWYIYDTAGRYTQDSSKKYQNTDYTNYPTYLISPSAGLVFWYEERDGKNTLFTSKPDTSNKTTIGSLTDYKTYGWYTDGYLLVSKNDSELYIMANAPIGSKQPLKITDYHKPNYQFEGYGGGYGGPN